MEHFYAVMHACKRAAEALEKEGVAEMETGMYKGSPCFSEVTELLSILAVRAANVISSNGDTTLRVSSIHGYPFFERMEG